MKDDIKENLRLHFNPDGSQLRQLQLRLVDMLIEFDDICKKHNINYWISSGTLLGAVRHKGFIPWDDDVDVEMLRSDYLKLLWVFESEKKGNYVFQTYKNDLKYGNPYGKFRDTNSLYVEANNCDNEFKYRGIFIDVFPIEPNRFFLLRFSASLHNWILRKNINSTNNEILIICLKHILFNGVFPVLRFISKIFSNPDYLYHTFGMAFYKPRKHSDIFPLSNIEFEGYLFPSPYSPDRYLKKIYGDYMKIPDTSNIKIHLNEIHFSKC